MSQSDKLAKWVFRHFVSANPEADFSHVIDSLDLDEILDFEAEVEARQHGINQIPQSHRVEEPYVSDEYQNCIDNFDLSFLSQVSAAVQSGRGGVQTPFNSSIPSTSTTARQNTSNVVYQSTPNMPSTSAAARRDINISGGNQVVQMGAGPSSRPRQLFTVESDAVRTYKKFNMQGTYYMLDIPPPRPQDNPEHWLRQLLNSVISYFVHVNNSKLAIRPGDYIGLELSNTTFAEKPVYVGLRRSDQLNADVIFEKIMSIFDSNKEFFINGKMEICFHHIQMPHGSGRITRQLGQTNESFIEDSISFIKYKNPRNQYPDDEYCLPYALVLARAALEIDQKDFRSFKRSVTKLRQAAVALCRIAGVNITAGGCSIEEVKKFQAALPAYQITVFSSLERGHVPYTDLEYHQKDNKLNIFLENGHYSAMRTLNGCLAGKYVCPDCHTRTSSWYKHKKCFYTCPSCLARPPCAPVTHDKMIPCNRCHRSFRGRECFNKHRTIEEGKYFSVCQRVKVCPDCKMGYYVDSNDTHDCLNAFCVTCTIIRPIEHDCFMPLYVTKRDPESNVLYIFYDFETQQNTLLHPQQPDKATKYKHVPNLCVVQTYCNTCRDEPNIAIRCEDCEERQHIFFSEDCVAHLLDLIVNAANARKPDEWEEVEDDYGPGPSCKRRKKKRGEKKFDKVVVIAHNMGGFDGQFILSYILNSQRFPIPKLIMNGTRLIQMRLGFNVLFLDSLNYFHNSLAALPEMFGLEGSKGYYPHLFNTRENAGVVCNLVDKSYFSPDSMSVKARAAFDEWYDKQPANYSFDNDKELIQYCIQDVNILRQACMKFSNEFWEINGIDPFLDACTIAGACNKVFRSNYLEPDTIGVVPANGYRYRDNQSKIALKWLSLVELNDGIEIQHAGRSAEKQMPGVGKVDGFHAPTNRVFEFMGCYWHGCEDCYPNQHLRKNLDQPELDREEKDPCYLRPVNEFNEDDERNQTMFLRRENTERKCKAIRDAGYNLVIMKECDFRKHLRNHPEAAALLENLPIIINSPLEPRDSFFGGRTNANKLYFKSDGVTKMYYFDICSLYPFINKTAKCPVGHPKVHIGEVCGKLQWQHMDGLMKVTVAPPRKLHFPVLPTRMHGKLMFVLCDKCGKELNKGRCNHSQAERSFTGTWVMDEVKLALRHGYEIVQIHEIWEYEVTRYDPVTREGGLFSGYINRFLKIKAEASGWPEECKTDSDKDAYIKAFYDREGIMLDKDKIMENPPLRAMAKVQLNSFWGRFGLRTDLKRTKIVTNYEQLVLKMLDPKIELNSVTPINDEALLLNYGEKDDSRLPNNSVNVIIAAFTTAYARMELYKYLEFLGPDRVFYFDTDSVIFTTKPGEAMPFKGDFLGEMTDELTKYGEGAYIIEFVTGGPKNYAFRVYSPATGKISTVIKVKGITLNHEISKIINFDLIKEYVTNPTLTAEGESAKVIVDGILTKRLIDSKEVSLDSIRRSNTADVYTTRTKKTYSLNYNKRQIIDDYCTIPFGY